MLGPREVTGSLGNGQAPVFFLRALVGAGATWHFQGSKLEAEHRLKTLTVVLLCLGPAAPGPPAASTHVTHYEFLVRFEVGAAVSTSQ